MPVLFLKKQERKIVLGMSIHRQDESFGSQVTKMGTVNQARLENTRLKIGTIFFNVFKYDFYDKLNPWVP